MKIEPKSNISVPTFLCAAFPGTGKSFYTEYKRAWNERVWDSDSSKWSKDKFPDNYIQHIKDGIGFADKIFVSSHKEVREALVSNKLPFTLIYPDKSLKSEYIERYKKRGNEDKFIELLEAKWEQWITECENQKECEHIVLPANTFISDVIDITTLNK